MEAGEQIKRIAGVVFRLILTVFICGGLTIAFSVGIRSETWEGYLEGSLALVGCSALGFLCARIAKVLLFGFAQLVENTESIRESSLLILRKLTEDPEEISMDGSFEKNK